MSRCIECDSPDTDLFRGDDGHFRKECLECGYIGGPYVSSQSRDRYDTEENESSQSAAESVFDY